MSEAKSYYVYALKDPRSSPAQAFYIGKGTGTRSSDHLLQPDSTRKGLRIQAIVESGAKVLVEVLVQHLTEAESLKIEAELIAAFGTEDSGGPLTNSVMPSGLSRKQRTAITVPTGAQERAQMGLSLLKEAVLNFVRANPQGVSNSDVASLLGLRSDYGGGSKDYLSYSILGLLMREGKVERVAGSKRHISRV
ncbi:GIY-YIG nuclease family protein [Comamonas jiangduensis]|uniref:GIY-YIG nuclease family protein n=1 Tax=Comamonas jiangduensis TaxID=1194168 RepID=UPI003BF9113D